jgi:multidrug transporter EmrE-like cation transporter
MKIAIIYILVSVLLSAVGQILLKKGMNDLGPMTINMRQLLGTLWRMGTNPYVFIGLFVYVIGVVFWLAALSMVDLSYAYPFASLSYIVMLVAAWLLFGEQISLLRLIGTLVVCLGVILIAKS